MRQLMQDATPELASAYLIYGFKVHSEKMFIFVTLHSSVMTVRV